MSPSQRHRNGSRKQLHTRRAWPLAIGLALLAGAFWAPALAQQALPAPVTYLQNGEAAASPFVAGGLQISVHFPAAPSTPPTIDINQPGASDVADEIMMATDNAEVWTYQYTIQADDAAAYIDGVAQLAAHGTDAEASEMVVSDRFFISTKLPTSPTLSLLAGVDGGTSDSDRIINDNQPTITGTLPGMGQRHDVARKQVPLVDPQNPATLTDAGKMVDGDDATFGIVSPAAGSPSLILDLAQPWLIHSLSLRTSTADGQVGSARIAVDGSATGADDNWINIYDDTSPQSEGVARELLVNNQGPWRYLRLRVIERNGDMRFYDLQALGTELGHISLFIDDAAAGTATSVADGTWSITTASLGEGNHVLTARVENEAGNVSALSDALNITIDRTPPSSSAGELSDKSMVKEISIPFSANDALSSVGLTKLFFSTDAAAPLDQYTQFGPGFDASPIPFTAPDDGTYYFYTLASDVAGNLEALPAEADASIVVNAAPDETPQPSIPPEIDAEQLSEVEDNTAPEGDQVLRLTEGEVDLTPVSVNPGALVSVTGFWRLEGHGTELQLCFDDGTCADDDRLGRIDGSSQIDTEWREFTLLAVAPEKATEAFLTWAVASDAYLDSPQWSISAVGMPTLLEEEEFELSVSAPALIDFGIASVGDIATATDIEVLVISTSPDGYKMEVQADHLRRTDEGTSTIGATSLSFREGTQSYQALTARLTRLQLYTTDTPTDSTGVTHLVDIELDVPPVPGGLYRGTIGFSATAY